ncbi:hypothetical protein EJ02DRAFT_457837 [Clathrospora elynae]|uniref:Uncharacterized protein n=1 Tax=Clathrospora elynae TaxID=706981 RepID=A0A6A5SFD7_9PLEO|nr:hypothetical protein EJ02DRAFT_457837 [Clathrospora elynae]
MAINIPDTTLSTNDKRILNALFDPETLPSSVAQSKYAAAIDSSLAPHPSISSTQLSDLESQQNDIVRTVSDSTEAIDAAITKLDQIVAEWPNYPSAHVNRAMLRRMRIEASLPADGSQNVFTAPKPSIEALFTDLARAIHLSLPASSPTAPVSTYQARILRTAYSHRAYLYLKAVETETELNGLGKSKLEELASKDFAAAARYGDEVAREMSVRTNPYAKMCGAIVRNALKEERKSEGI